MDKEEDKTSRKKSDISRRNRQREKEHLKEIRELLAPFFGHLRKGLQDSGNKDSDLDGDALPFRIEAKRRISSGHMPVKKAFEQVMRDAKSQNDDRPVIVWCRYDNSHPDDKRLPLRFVCILEETFMDMISKIYPKRSRKAR